MTEEQTIKMLLAVGESERKYSCDIHEIKIKSWQKKVEITIKLGSPGMFIGLHGKRIEKITKKIAERINKEVSINLIDFNPLSFS